MLPWVQGEIQAKSQEKAQNLMWCGRSAASESKQEVGRETELDGPRLPYLVILVTLPDPLEPSNREGLVPAKNNSQGKSGRSLFVSLPDPTRWSGIKTSKGPMLRSSSFQKECQEAHRQNTVLLVCVAEVQERSTCLRKGRQKSPFPTFLKKQRLTSSFNENRINQRTITDCT